MVDFLILCSRFHIISPDSFSLGEIKSEKEIPEKRSYRTCWKKIIKQYTYLLIPKSNLRFWNIKYIEKLLQILWALVLCKDAVYCKKTDVRSYLFKLYPIGDTFPTLHICSSKVTTLTVPVEDCIKLFCIVFLYHSLPPKSSLRNQVGLTLSDLDCLCSLSK